MYFYDFFDSLWNLLPFGIDQLLIQIFEIVIKKGQEK